MKALLVTLVPVVASLMAATTLISINKKETVLPHSKNGEMPIGNARDGDSNIPNGTRSFWQLDADPEHMFQL